MDPDQMWLVKTRSQVMVVDACGCGVDSKFDPALFELVAARAPRVHCQNWRPGDDERRFHGGYCRLSRAERAMASRPLSRRLS